MNPLLTLMHDTAHCLGRITTQVVLIKKRLEKLNVSKDEEIEYKLKIILEQNRILMKHLDDYYVKAKEYEKNSSIDK